MSKFIRSLTTFDLTMIAIGSTIGSGIFLTPGNVMNSLPSAVWVIIVWTVGGLACLSGALTFAELAGRKPGTGGVYNYLKEGYGPLWGFLYGWANLLVITSGAIAALAVAFADHLLYIIYGNETLYPPWSVEILASTGILLLTVMNVMGMKHASIFSNVSTILKLAGIVFIVFTAFFLFPDSHLDLAQSLPETSDFNLGSAFAAGLIGVFWSYGGWQHASYVSTEAIDPKKSVARAMIMGIIVITLTYVITNIAYMRLLPIDDMTHNSKVAATAVARAIGPAAGILVAGIIFISTFGTTGIYTMTAPRIYFAMSEDKSFFAFLAKLNPKTNTPANSIILQSLWSILLILLWGTFSNLINYVLFTDWIFMVMACAAIYIFRYKKEEYEGFRTPFYPLMPLGFIVISTWFLVYTLIDEPLTSVAGLVLLGLGALVYFIRKWVNKGQ